ncbi:hypothetical protein JKP88DRAFT_33138 [Tribonema minus]|uniref:Uncharacterized protein n=1 Tax=Tribonema minus TaxID=303371 RepID=A0A836CJ44_9STRA|nr:hypothetical protein JKP88DRAFT_33138 [Tribonema minus]
MTTSSLVLHLEGGDDDPFKLCQRTFGPGHGMEFLNMYLPDGTRLTKALARRLPSNQRLIYRGSRAPSREVLLEGRARLTWYESYPTSTKEAEDFNAKEHIGEFAYLPDQQFPEARVREMRIAAFFIHPNLNAGTADQFAGKRIVLTRADGGTIGTAFIYDTASDEDCKNNEVSTNAARTGYLVDLERYTAEAFFGDDWETDCAGYVKFQIIN